MKQSFLSITLMALFILVSSAPSTFSAIIESRGWFESLYVKWNKAAGAVRYDVEYRPTSGGAWIKIDDYLVREYSDHIRADILGLRAGAYEVRVTPNVGSPMTAGNITVMAHERTGFAFMNNVVPGAYKADGTLKDNAVVIYVTDKNKDTLSFDVVTAANGNTTKRVGLQNIVNGIEQGYERRPIAIRVIGRITDENFRLDLGGGDIVIKDNNRREEAPYSFITIEGVGNDATLYGWSFRTNRAQNLEIRNLGFMLTKSTGGDNIEINSNSRHIWIHHNDMFYGSAGSASDQVKGDGATDVKASTNVTIAYNRYWDTGKTHLLGNSANETPGDITIHHNWYDHSDSRHPRVRKHNVHVYNNYYNNVSTYGIGAVIASSIFAEKNYFSETHRPMMISMQGTDIASGSGTFSSEDGGIIKAFNNFMDAYSANSSRYRPYSSSNTVEFDAYEVTSASATVPNTVTAKRGGATFNNNMIPANYPPYVTQNDSAAVRLRVTSYAGRTGGSDFSYNITNGRNSGVIEELKSALLAYRGGLQAVLGEGNFTPPPVSSVVNRSNNPPVNSMAVSRVDNGAVSVDYTIINRGNVRMDLFDIKGNRVKTLVNASRGAGVYRERFAVSGLAAGRYLLRLDSGGALLQERITITK